MLAALAGRTLRQRGFSTFSTRLAEVVSTPSRNPVLYKPLARVVDGFKTYKPITPSLRHLRRPISPHIYAGRPFASLPSLFERKVAGTATATLLFGREEEVINAACVPSIFGGTELDQPMLFVSSTIPAVAGTLL